MTETIQDLKAIVDGAFGKATHINEQGEYLKLEGAKNFVYYGNKNKYAMNTPYLNDFIGVRALSDIKARIELMEEVERLREALIEILEADVLIQARRNKVEQLLEQSK